MKCRIPSDFATKPPYPDAYDCREQQEQRTQDHEGEETDDNRCRDRKRANDDNERAGDRIARWKPSF